MADRLRALIVDDEPAAVRRLVRLCAALPEVEVVATAGDGRAAIEALDAYRCDLLLLDIEMPGMSGLALAECLVGRDPAPAIVFVTAFDRFAIQAFAVDAVGYLLKPVDPALLGATVERLVSRASLAAPAGAGAPDPTIFWVPHRGALIRLAADDVDLISAEDDYVRLHSGERSYLVAERLYAVEDRMAGAGFVRVHRSTLVNRDRIAGLELAHGGWWVILTSGGRTPIGRSHLPGLRRALQIAP